MKEIHSIQIDTDIPGYQGFIFTARFIDKSKGYRETKYGKVLKWDKIMSMYWDNESLDEGIVEFGNKITETLCEDIE